MKRNKIQIPSSAVQITLVVVFVLLIRILLVNGFQGIQQTHGLNFYDFVAAMLSDWPTIAVSVVGAIGFIVLLNRRIPYGRSPMKHLFSMFAYVVAFSVLSTLILCRREFSELFSFGALWSDGSLLLSFLASALFNVVAVIVVDLAVYLRHSSIELKTERNKKRKVQYQYSQLKQQLNPHFLFNSLNILDYLVSEGENRRASDFIKKLAGTYRYMLSTEEEKYVELRDEIKFVGMYSALLVERFPDGFDVDVDLPEWALGRGVIPCAVQMLVENATKHNIVSPQQPLHVTVRIEGDQLVVRNNLQPRLTPYDSTGVGLRNIRRQYADIAGKEISVERTDGEFIVRLPLI